MNGSPIKQHEVVKKKNKKEEKEKNRKEGEQLK